MKGWVAIGAAEVFDMLPRLKAGDSGSWFCDNLPCWVAPPQQRCSSPQAFPQALRATDASAGRFPLAPAGQNPYALRCRCEQQL